MGNDSSGTDTVGGMSATAKMKWLWLLLCASIGLINSRQQLCSLEGSLTVRTGVFFSSSKITLLLIVA